MIQGKVDEYYIGDDVKLNQMLMNILGNAVKSTPAPGTASFIVEHAAQYRDKFKPVEPDHLYETLSELIRNEA